MKIFVTRKIPDNGIEMLKQKGYVVNVSPEDRVLKREELLGELQKGKYDAVLPLLTDKIDAEVMNAAGKQCKIFANYAVGFDNIDLQAAHERGIFITNTPGVLTNSVAEHAFGLLLSICHRIVEADRFAREGRYQGWEPMLLLGSEVAGKTLGIVGLGRIGARMAYHGVKGFDMKVVYYDVVRSEAFEKEFDGSTSDGKSIYRQNADDIFREADFISIHVPLLPSTKHLVDARRLSLMKKTAYLINTSRGPVVDENALVSALKENAIAGAALDVFENEPNFAPGLIGLPNVIVTPHIASATNEARQEMSHVAATNIIEALEGRTPPNVVKATS